MDNSESIIILRATVLFILCLGEPDLLDALIHHYLK